jgi:cytochrome P450
MLVTESGSWARPSTLLASIRTGIGENLFTQSEKHWARLQPAVAPSFRKKALEARLAGLDAIIADDVAALPLDTDIDLELAMGIIALRVAAWVLLGEALDHARAEEIASHQREVVSWVGTRVGELTGFIPMAWGDAGRAMKEHRAVLNAYADEVIARAQARRAPEDDVMGALLRARPHGRPLSPSELQSHVLGLFLAGNETTAAALSWALVHGAHHPTEWARLRADAAAVGPYIDETMRLTPAVWGIPRTPARGGLDLARRGQVVTIYLRGINRDPKIWADPLEFDPDRHRVAGKDAQRALLPFGLGPRGCIGQHLAQAEMLAAVPALARHGDVQIAGAPVEDASFALRVRGGLRGRFTSPCVA